MDRNSYYSEYYINMSVSIFNSGKIMNTLTKILSWLLHDFVNTYKKAGFIKTISIMAIATAILMAVGFISFWLEFFIVATFWIILIIEAIGEVENISRRNKKWH